MTTQETTNQERRNARDISQDDVRASEQATDQIEEALERQPGRMELKRKVGAGQRTEPDAEAVSVETPRYLYPGMFDGAALFDMKLVERKPLVAGLILEGDLVVLAGRPKTGKSLLALQLARSVDEGKPFLGRSTIQTPVLYVALEDGVARLSERLKAVNWRPNKTLFWTDQLKLGNGGTQSLRGISDAYGLIIIDSLRAACGPDVDENDNAKMGGIVQQLANVAHETGTTILITHHTRKGDPDDDFDSIRGAGAIRGAYDIGMLLKRSGNDGTSRLRVESRDRQIPDMSLKFEGGAGWSLAEGQQNQEHVFPGSGAYAALLELGGKGTIADVATKMMKSMQAAGQQLITLESAGKVERESTSVPGTKPVYVYSITS